MSRFFLSNIFLLFVWFSLSECFPDCTQNIYALGCRGYGMKRSGNEEALLKHQEFNDKRNLMDTDSFNNGNLITSLKHNILKDNPSINLRNLENLRILYDQQKRIQQLNDMINSRIQQTRDYAAISAEYRK